MAINKKLIHFKKYETFMSSQGVNGNYSTPSSGIKDSGNAIYGQIPETSIVFIRDTKQIWTWGRLYNCSDPDLSNYLTPEDLTEINKSISDLETSNATKITQSQGDARYALKADIPTSESDLTHDMGYVTKTTADNTYATIVTAQGLQKEIDNLETNVANNYVTNTVLTTELGKKQNTISDLSTIRSNAALGATALQEGDLDDVNDSISTLQTDVNSLKTNKLDVSTASNTYATKSSLSSYVPTTRKVNGVALDKDITITATDPNAVTKAEFNEYKTTVNNTLTGYATDSELSTGLSKKQDVISDLATIRSGAAAGATALQEGDLDDINNSISDLETLVANKADSSSLSNYAKKTDLNGYVPTARTVNGKALSANISLSAGDVGAPTTNAFDTLNEEVTDLKTLVNNKLDTATASDTYATKTALSEGLAAKQATLVSGTNIKTIDGTSILGSGDIQITASQVGAYTKNEIDTKVTTINNSISSVSSQATTNKNAIATLNGAESTTGSVKAIAKSYANTAESNANDYTDEVKTSLQDQITSNDNDITTINNKFSSYATTSALSGVSNRVTAIEGLIATDSDAVIDKWDEVVTFLDGIGTDNDLEALLASKANQSALNATNTTIANLKTDAVAEGSNNLYFTNARARSAITGGASTVTSSNLTANRALISNSSGKITVSDITATELGYLDGVTSNIQSQLDAKAPISLSTTVANLTTSSVAEGTNLYHTASRARKAVFNQTEVLTANRALVSDANGYVAESAVTSTELGYLDGVTSAIQTQLNNKAAKSVETTASTNASNISTLQGYFSNGKAKTAAAADTATTATKLASAPSLSAGTSNTNKITITAGGQTSSEFTVPYATNAGSASTATSAATAATCTGNSATATALTTTSKGSATNPIYWDANGKPVACTYSLNKTVPANAVFTDTWRTIQCNDTSIGSNTLNLKAGTNVSLSNSNGTITISSTNTTYSSKAAASGGTDVSLVTTGEKYTWNNKQNAISDLATIRSNATNGNTAYGWGNHASVGYVKSSGIVSGQVAIFDGTEGKIKNSGHTIAASVPSGAKFTDTTYSAGTGLSLSGGTFSADGTSIINALGVGDSPATREDFIVAQYAGGGTTNTTYLRRKLSNIFAALNKSDITTALGYTPPTSDTNTWRPIYNGVDSTATDTSASANAVKTAYDKAVSAYDLANGKTANKGTVTSVATGAGLTGGTITTSGTIKANLKSETKSTLSSTSMGSTSSRQYAVGLDKDGYLSVNIPWTDTTYTLSSLGIGNVKNYDQSKAIKSITRSGTTFTYTCLDGTTGTFTQQDNNTTYSVMGAATSSAAGSSGLVPAPAAGKQASFLRGDGTWAVPTNTTYSVATTSANGLMSSTDKSKLDGIASGATAVSSSTVSGWGFTKNAGTITGVTAGNGLTDGGTSGAVTLNVGAGTGISVAADKVSCNLNSTSSLGTIGTTSKLYAVGVDANGKLAVSVPWTDSNTDTKYWQETTYASLVSLRNNKNLVPGRFYRITDYVTTVNSNYAGSSAGIQFDIIVQAIGTSTLSEDATACANANDNYFTEYGANVEGWKLKYCLDNDTERFDWADSSGKGVIYRMIDEYNNDCPFDFKNILDANGNFFFSGWGTNYGQPADASLQTDGVTTWVVMNNTLQYLTGSTTSAMNLPNSSIYVYEGGNIVRNTFHSMYNCNFDTIEGYMSDNKFEGIIMDTSFAGTIDCCTFGNIYNSTFSATNIQHCRFWIVAYTTFNSDSDIKECNIHEIVNSSFTGSSIAGLVVENRIDYIIFNTSGAIKYITFEGANAYLTFEEDVNISGPIFKTAVQGTSSEPLDLSDVLIRSSSGGISSIQTVYRDNGGNVVARYTAPYSYSSVDDADQVPTTANVCYWPVSESSTLAFSGNLYNGMDVHIIIENVSDASVTIALPTEDPFVKTGVASSLILAAGKCGEINALMINNKVFLRASL